MLDALSSTIHKDQEKTLKHLHEYNQNLTKSRDTLQANVTTLNNAIEELNRKLKLSAIENSQLSDKLKVVQSESDSKVEVKAVALLSGMAFFQVATLSDHLNS